jgi:enoyl-CoA hydratase/carnithine racemase
MERRERAEREAGLGGLARNLDPGKPVIAAVNGHGFADGLEPALGCGVRIAAEHATFGSPEARRGIMPFRQDRSRPLPERRELNHPRDFLLLGYGTGLAALAEFQDFRHFSGLQTILLTPSKPVILTL